MLSSRSTRRGIRPTEARPEARERGGSPFRRSAACVPLLALAFAICVGPYAYAKGEPEGESAASEPKSSKADKGEKDAKTGKPASTLKLGDFFKRIILEGLVSCSYSYEGYELMSTETRANGSNTGRKGTEEGGLNGAAVFARLSAKGFPLFLCAQGSYRAGEPKAKMYMFTGTDGTIFKDYTKLALLSGEARLGYSFDLGESLPFRIDTSTGIGLSRQTRTFDFSETGTYTENLDGLYLPICLDLRYLVAGRMDLGLEGYARIPLKEEKTLELLDYAYTIDYFYEAKPLKTEPGLDYRVGFVIDYLFAKELASEKLMTLRSLTLNPYFEHWSAKKSGSVTVYKIDAATEAKPGTSEGTLIDWDSMVNVFGIRLALCFIL